MRLINKGCICDLFHTFILMETTINSIHLQILKNKDLYQVFPNKGVFPVDMENQGEGWKFISPKIPSALLEIQSEISDFIDANLK